MRIERLDPRDEESMSAWHAAYLAAQRHDRPHATPWMLDELRAMLNAEREAERDLAFSGIADGTVVCVGMCSLTMLDNVDKAHLEVHTVPDRRRRGHGTRMLEQLEGVARDLARTVLVTEVAYPYEAPVDGTGTPFVEFARRRGYSFGLGNVQRILELPVEEEGLRGLVAAAAPHHQAYTFRQFVGRIPDDIVDSFAAILGTLVTEAPTGEIEHEPERFDEARIRADENVFDDSGRTKFTTVALDRAGEVAAFSELVLPRHDPGHVFQWGTLARPQDRGHRLGLATKARNLLWAQPELGRRTLVTFNADVNAHMIAVNEQMGFRPVERLGEFQKRLA